MTLYEIIAIDTSLNQAEAGQNDITGLISPTSLIPSSWGGVYYQQVFKLPLNQLENSH